jgi:geranylgeranyl diphosphate synthase, type I
VGIQHEGSSGSVPSGAPPADLGEIATRVEARLDHLLTTEIDRWSQIAPDVTTPLRELRAMVLGGGKRLRPGFVHWGFRAAGGDPADPIVADAGAAFEMLHVFALIHDDVVDDSARRRGRATVHMVFGAEHAAQGHRGEERRFGEGVAVLVGDFAHVYADMLAAGFPAEAVALWNELRVELNVGQYLDLLGTARGDTDLAGAERVVRYKSAKYTIERPLHLGAALAGRFDELGPVFTAYGIPLGEAFQLRDDLLGVFGDPDVTGKPVGDDLREGKPTPLLALTVERATPAQRAVLDRIGAGDLSADEIVRCQAVMTDTGAVDLIEARIAQGRDIALAALDRVDLDGAVRRALDALAVYVTARDR